MYAETCSRMDSNTLVNRKFKRKKSNINIREYSTSCCCSRCALYKQLNSRLSFSDCSTSTGMKSPPSLPATLMRSATNSMRKRETRKIRISRIKINPARDIAILATVCHRHRRRTSSRKSCRRLCVFAKNKQKLKWPQETERQTTSPSSEHQTDLNLI